MDSQLSEGKNNDTSHATLKEDEPNDPLLLQDDNELGDSLAENVPDPKPPLSPEQFTITGDSGNPPGYGILSPTPPSQSDEGSQQESVFESKNGKGEAVPSG